MIVSPRLTIVERINKMKKPKYEKVILIIKRPGEFSEAQTLQAIEQSIKTACPEILIADSKIEPLFKTGK